MDTRFSWFQHPGDPSSGIVTYRFKVVLFGSTCSQYLLNATILKHLSTINEETGVLRRGLYIYNIQLTSNDTNDLLNMFHQSLRVFSSAHLYLKECVTNNSSLTKVTKSHGVASEE